MKAIELSEVAALSPHVKPGCAEPLLLTDHGQVVATIVPASEQDAESMLLSINPKFEAILERSRRRLEAEVNGSDPRKSANARVVAPSAARFLSLRAAILARKCAPQRAREPRAGCPGIRSQALRFGDQPVPTFNGGGSRVTPYWRARPGVSARRSISPLRVRGKSSTT